MTFCTDPGHAGGGRIPGFGLSNKIFFFWVLRFYSVGDLARRSTAVVVVGDHVQYLRHFGVFNFTHLCEQGALA